MSGIDKKVHFSVSEFPYLRWPRRLDLLCGDPMEDAVLLHTWDEIPVGTAIEWNTIGSCSKCQAAIKDPTKVEGVRLVYAVKSARALKATEAR